MLLVEKVLCKLRLILESSSFCWNDKQTYYDGTLIMYFAAFWTVLYLKYIFILYKKWVILCENLVKTLYKKYQPMLVCKS